MIDKESKEKEQALRREQHAKQQVEKALAQAQKDSLERSNAQEKARNIELIRERSKMTYKSLFIGQMIFTFALAFFVAYGKHEVLSELIDWFPSRWNNFLSVLDALKSGFSTLVGFPINNWETSEIWGYIFAVGICLFISAIVYFFYRWSKEKIKDFVWKLKLQYLDGTLKAIVSGDVVLIMLYICLFFPNEIKSIFPFNLFSTWLILSFIGVSICNLPEIKNTILN